MNTRVWGRFGISRRRFLQTTSLAVAGMGSRGRGAWGGMRSLSVPLEEFGYGDVAMASEAHEAQLMNTHEVLMALSEDSLLKPFRQMSGMAAPGEELGGWYNYDPDYDYRKGFDNGFAPGCTFGQWVSALARVYAITGEEATREKVLRLNRLYAETITGDFYEKNRFPAYTYDKLLLGLIDSHTLCERPAGDGDFGAHDEHGAAASAGARGGARGSVADGQRSQG